jgi:hypothetical protein
MTSRKITVRAIFGKDGLPTRFLFPIDGKYVFMDSILSNDTSIDEFCMELMPPEAQKPKIETNANIQDQQQQPPPEELLAQWDSIAV